ncbi:MAG: TlpA disulfide reductase family protein [Candidatus Pedobacter colombiensis]|uniref:TlpA disulfide reductase family protein n=1 Tax=Candidatus Pedobacter colombiensis TaxID=3121371 RepID=A0AAJ5WDR8_9SPHI|nr:TlpA disulfide reductase family protein [Pedobacter sp.]WEK21614.1 MAG: TlpA disulfide reductase family protein [Pedobacter sp.]
MRKLQIVFLLMIITFCSFTVMGQTVKLLTLDQLDQRITKGGDTVYVINFWASWCAPCLKELPYFEKLSQTTRKDKVKVLLISLDFKSKLTSTVVPIVKSLKLKNEVYLLNENNQQAYIERIDKDWSGALPATLFINKVKSKRIFKEQEFTFQELINTYQQIK